MVPPLGKITSFFKPYVIKRKGGATEQFDGDNITVASNRAVPTEVPQRPNPLNSLKRAISPSPSSKSSRKSAQPAKRDVGNSRVRPRPGGQSVPTAESSGAASALPVSNQYEASTPAASTSKERSPPRTSWPDGRPTPIVRTATLVVSRPDVKARPTEREPDGQPAPAESRSDEPSTPVATRDEAQLTPTAVRSEAQLTPTAARSEVRSTSPATRSEAQLTPTAARPVVNSSSTAARSEIRPTFTAVGSEAQLTSTVARPAAKSTPELHHEQPSDDGSPLSILSHSPSRLLSVRTITRFQQPDVVMDNPVPPPVLKPTRESTVTSSFSSTSSRRVVVNGKKAVTNSDSDSVSSSSDDGLEDPASYMPRKRMKMTPPGQDSAHAIILPDDDEPAPVRITKITRKTVAPVRKNYRHSLLNLVRQVERDEATTARIKQAEADVEQHSLKVNGGSDVDMGKPGAELFADESDQERIQAALDRVEAVEESDVFYFFHGSDNAGEHAPWPAWEMLAPLLRNERAREVSIRSRFLTDLATQIDLPQDVLTWIHRALQVEESEVLCEEYLSILHASSWHKRATGSHEFSTRKAYHGNDKAAGLPSNLRYDLRLSSCLAERLPSPQERAIVLGDLFLLNLDDHVRNSLDIQSEIERAVRAVFETTSREDVDSLVQLTIGQILKYDLLTKQQLARGIAVLPATTTALHQFRRQLALHYMLNPSSHDTISTTSLATGGRLLNVLTDNPLFSVSSETNWTLFHWIVHLLDICIDAGFSDFSFTDANPMSQKEGQDEKMFNRQVDEISQRLRLIANSIRAAGTSHLRRAEAKSALERLVVRIELSVRTGSKRKKAVFGGKIGVGQRDIKNFLAHADSDDEDEAFQTQLKPAKNIHGRKSVKFDN